MAIEPDYYEVLGVGQDASRDEIKASYRREVRAHHPDAAPAEQKRAAHAKIQLIIAAWTALGDVTSRAAYDERRRRAGVEESRQRSEASSREPSGSAPPVEATPIARRGGAGEDGRKRNRVQAVMGAGQAPRPANPRTKLLAMVFDAAQLYHVEGRPDEAARVCQSVLRADPTNAEAAVLLADIYTSQSKRSAALDLLERALRLQPSNALYRSKWEALRHSATPSASAPAASTARTSGHNPWSRAAQPSPLASRIARRPEESTESTQVPTPRAEDQATSELSDVSEPSVHAANVDSRGEEVSEVATIASGVEDVVEHEALREEPILLNEEAEVAPAQPSQPQPSQSQKGAGVDSAIPKASLLQRLRSKLAR